MAVHSTWKIDSMHSQVQFKVKHLAISNVNGVFKTFEGYVACDGDTFDKAMVQATIAAESIDTRHTDRDTHLKSQDFFDTATYPTIQFQGVLKEENGVYLLPGELTIRNATRPITLEAEFTGTGRGRFGDERAGFEATGKINRKEFGLTWNILAEGGGWVVGDEIKLHFDIELIRQPDSLQG